MSRFFNSQESKTEKVLAYGLGIFIIATFLYLTLLITGAL